MIGKLTVLSLLALAQGMPYEASHRSLSAHDLCPENQRHYLLPHEYDCTLFYYCEYGMRYDEPTRCAPRTEFSGELQVCIHPELANCHLPGVPPTEEKDNENEGGDNKPEVPESVESLPESVEQNPDVEEENPVPVEPQPESEEQKPELEEQEPTEVQTTPKPAETQPESEEQNPEVEEQEPHVVETTPKPAEPQPESEEQKPEVEEQEPEVVETTPKPAKPQPESEEQNLEVDEQEPEVLETTSKPAEPQPESEEENPESQEQKPEAEEVESVPVEPLPESEEQKPEVEEQKPESAEIEGSEVESEEQKPPQGWLPNGCPADIHVHWLLPHESECDKFYYCNFGEKVLTACAPGTYFNFAIQVCDWPENVNCANTDSGSGDKVNGNDDEDSGDSDNGSGDNEDGSGDSENDSGDSGNNGDGTLPNGCPINSDVHHLLPHEAECGKFYQCVHGDKIEQQCGGELQFNPILQICDWPWNVNCENSSDGNGEHSEENSASSGENNVNSGENNENSSENENHGSGEDNVSLPNGCSVDFNVNQLLPHDSDCSKFYYCLSGEKVENECAGGLHFNPALQVCDWPENVHCSNNNENSEENKDNSEENSGNTDENNGNSGENNDNTDESNGNSGENNGNTDDSNGNSGENNGSTDDNNGNSGENNGNTDESNGNSGENNGNGEDTDEVPDNSKCANSCNTKPWAHAFACDKFWRCEGEEATLVICSEGLFFNSNTGTCDFMCNVNCVRDHVQTTANAQGLQIFVPWDKVDDNIKESYMPLSKNVK